MPKNSAWKATSACLPNMSNSLQSFDAQWKHCRPRSHFRGVSYDTSWGDGACAISLNDVEAFSYGLPVGALEQDSCTLCSDFALRVSAQDFLWLVVFTSWMDLSPHDLRALKLSVLELFAGCSRIAKTAKHRGWSSRAYEINFDKGWNNPGKRDKRGQKQRSFMDMNGQAGLAHLGGPTKRDSF